MTERKELTIAGLKDGMKVTDEQLDSRVEETDLPELAACFDNTEDYVETLQLTPPQKNDVKMRLHQNGTQAGAKEVLKCWRNNSPLMATFRALILILLLLSKGNVAVAVCKYLSDKYSCPTQPGILTNPGLLLYRDYLKGRYEVLVSTSSVQWPPLPTTKVFKLAMIRKNRIQRGKIDEKFVRLSITGSVDDILRREIAVQLENIFCESVGERRFVLIEGAPGSGKSTLALFVCQEWAKGKLVGAFKDYDAVIHVRLRDPHIREAMTLEDLLPSRNATMAHEAAAEMMANDGRGVLWVLDGWDELPSDLPQDSIINKLITPDKSPLHKCALIVTSRPSSSVKLHPLVTSRVEVLGFTPTEMEQYFTECLNGNTQAVQTLLERIRQNPAVEGSCYLPLNTSIVAHVYISGDHSLPTSNHGIFTSVVKFSLSRYMQDRLGMSSEKSAITTLDALPKNVLNFFAKLCKLAYYGVVKNKVTFVTDDFRAAGVSMKVCDLGLLQTVSSVLVDGRESYFNFLHHSIQELLAAIHISHMSATNQIAVFKDLFGNPRFTAVFEFYAGITKLKTCRPYLSLVPNFFFPNTPRRILDLVSGIVKSKDTRQLVSLLRCLHETEDPTLCYFVAKLLGQQLDLSYTALSPLDCFSIGYFLSVISTSFDDSFNVNFYASFLGDHEQGYKFLARGLSKCFHSNTNVTSKLTLNLPHNNISIQGIKHIATLLKDTCTSAVCKLNLSSNEAIGDNGLERLCEALSTNTTLEELNISGCSISDAGVHHLGMLLKNTSAIHKLNLSSNKIIGDRGLEMLCEALSTNTTLEELDLSRCSISEVGVQHISTLLKNTSAVRKLNLSSNIKVVGDSGLEMLCEALSTNTTLEELNLSECSVSEVGVQHVATLLRNNSTVRKLDLSDNEAIGAHSGLARLCEALSTNTTLKELDLRVCSISDNPSLSQLLSTNKCIVHLDLSFNSLTTCSHLADGLSYNHTLKDLWLNGCQLTDQSVTDLCTGLNNYIEELHIIRNYSLSVSGMMVLADHLTTLSCMRRLRIPLRLMHTINTVFRDANKSRRKKGLPGVEVIV